MFDRLVASGAEGQDAKSRRNYFMASTFLVGVLFVAGVVVSIFAADFSLGGTDLTLETMLAPVEVAADKPEPPRPRLPASGPTSSSQTSRVENMARTDESQFVPTSISTAPNAHAARPLGQFTRSKIDAGPGTPSGPVDRPVGGDPGRENTFGKDPSKPKDDPDPIEVAPTLARKTPPTRSIGVINGKAVSLPKPNYSAAAIAVHAVGAVNVAVTLDETGKVIAANAVTGHPLLKAEAERAAWKARFSPTLLSNVPVKVTGVIVYNFVR